MWGNRSFSGKKTSPKSRFNSTLPAFVTSPISTRQRQPDRLNQSMNTSVLSAAGPPLSSPFMPQIKRALGLEPDQKRPYSGIQRRHSFNTTGLKTSSCLPHVVLNKSRQLPLTERNSSMLKRSSTVRIAPPTPGKISSPSLYQMRNNTISQEDRSTPDTYAVVSALKERRKRSITTQEENHEVPIQHAKRRRQESQQSNASTSSMPSLPDHLPDLTTDYTIRIETPNLNRPSRPSQEVHSTWEPDSSLNLTRQDSRNNSILSSLSSSKRFAISQRNKRRLDTSQIESESLEMSSKLQRRDPPKLSHFDSPLTTPVPLAGMMRMTNGETNRTLPNGHTEKTTATLEKTNDRIPQPDKLVAKPTTLKQLPTLKKKTSVYSALSQNSSFRKAQFANVVATLDDYDSDREAENRRVQQMLNDVDESFSEKKQDKLVTSKQSSETTTTTTSSTSIATGLPAITSTVSATTSSSGVISVTTGSSAVTTQPVPKSPIQEVGDNSTAKATNLTSVTASNKTLSSLLAQTESPVTSYSVLSAVSSDTKSLASTPASAPNFNFGTTPTSANSVPSSQVVNSSGQSGSAGFGSQTTMPVSSTATGLNIGGTNTVASSRGSSISSTGATLTSKPVTGGFNFGGVTGTQLNSAVNAALGLAMSGNSNQTTVSPVTSPNPTPSAGFSFGNSTPASTNNSTTVPGGQTSQPAGFAFGSSGVSTVAAPSTTGVMSQAVPSGGFTFGTSATSATTPAPAGLGIVSKPASTAAPSLGASGVFSFGNSGPVAPAPQASSGFSLGTSTAPSTASSTPGGFTFGTTASVPAKPAGGFNFAPTASNATPSAGTVFNKGPVASTAASQNAGGFLFGGVQASSGSASVFPGANPASTTASASAFGGFPGSNPATTTASASAFGGFPGANSVTTTASMNGFGGFSQQAAQPATGGFNFGTGSSNPTPNVTTFGTTQAATNASTSSSLFAFGGGGASTTAASSTPFMFNSGAAKTTASATPFNFNAGSTGTTAPTTSAGAGFNFGQSSSTSTAAPTGTFQFGASNTSATKGFAFGSANQTPAFGSSTNQAPAFGSTNQTPAFGSSSNQTPAFGSTNQSSVFGAPTQPPAFGAPTFGGNSQTQPATGSVFGAPAATTQQSGVSNMFGASTNNSNSSMFGGGAGQAPGFAKSHSMPTFGSSNATNPGTFTFEGQTAPNVNPFGQGPTTPAKQTGSAFGALNTDVTPQNQTGSVFAFGQQNNSSVKKGFDFSSAAGGATPNNGGFNFASTPGTGFAAPAGNASFSVGAGKPARPIAKGRRRVPRR